MFCSLLYIPEIIATLWLMDVRPIEVKQDNYTRYLLQDSCVVEVIEYADSALVVETVCAPICSSRARIYSKENKILREIQPTCGGVFPYAWIENGILRWRDNTDEMLDEHEKR